MAKRRIKQKTRKTIDLGNSTKNVKVITKTKKIKLFKKQIFDLNRCCFKICTILIQPLILVFLNLFKQL